MSFDALWAELEPIGRDPRTGGYRRYVYGPAELHLREWFIATAADRGLDVVTDRVGNLWAWWGDPDADGPGLVLGSHLDSVPNGGAYDGPLGVVSAFAVMESLQRQGFQPTRPLAVVAFADEEGARFGIACAGSRILTGALDPDRARALTDTDGVTYAEAMRAGGVDPARVGRDAETLARVGSFVELHVEQGRALVDVDAAVGVGTAIWPHGRWRFTFDGEANHAGTTLMTDRRDPMLTYAMAALGANKQARVAGARATFGRVVVEPNGTNAVPSRVTAWLDARAADQATLDGLLAAITKQALERAGRDGTTVDVEAESVTPVVDLDGTLRDAVAAAVRRGARSAASVAADGGVAADSAADVDLPAIPTAAGHDAGILATAGIPTAMLFVRNPTGVSHSPAEYAEREDCHAGVVALEAVVRSLAGGRSDVPTMGTPDAAAPVPGLDAPSATDGALR